MLREPLTSRLQHRINPAEGAIHLRVAIIFLFKAYLLCLRLLTLILILFVFPTPCSLLHFLTFKVFLCLKKSLKLKGLISCTESLVSKFLIRITLPESLSRYCERSTTDLTTRSCFSAYFYYSSAAHCWTYTNNSHSAQTLSRPGVIAVAMQVRPPPLQWHRRSCPAFYVRV